MGPHFYFDLIRLPRKGWSTFFRCLYLGVLLLGLTVMYEGRRHTINNLGDYARFAHSFAYTLIVMQDILVLVLLPVYVASAVAEERENQTLEALFVSPLTDRQIVLGKFGGRLLHLGAVILAGVPLLAFMHMWGNVALSMLVYHLLNTLLLAMTATSICILVSTHAPVVFQAVTNSYPFVFVLGLGGEVVAFSIPWIIDSIYVRGPGAEGTPRYWEALIVLVPTHWFLTYLFLLQAMAQMDVLRRLETVPLKKKSAAFSLTDEKTKPLKTRKGRLQGSHIHPLAMPISDRALFWKECLKDGTNWSLTWTWAGTFLLVVLGVSFCFQVLTWDIRDTHRVADVKRLVAPFAYCAYFIALAAYGLLLLFQTTIAVAGEREQNTLEFLLMLPVERGEILFSKWLGPLWRNWPILAISYLGVLLGLGCGVYSLKTALVMWLLPVPFILLCSFFALWLSVMCRRVLFANIVLVGFLLLLLMGHIVSVSYTGDLFPSYGYLLFEVHPGEFTEINLAWGLFLVMVEQIVFLLVAGLCGWLAFRHFGNRDYVGKN
jgi:ABC-type transport system involved in multi-copper enzyme maturation permease subunit